MSERMNKERAKQEIIATRKTYADKKQKLEEKNEFEKSELKRRENKSFIHLYDNKINALDIAIESLEREDKLIELAEQNKWHTEQPQEDRQYLVTYYQECDLLIMCKWKNKQWYDSKGIALDNDRVVAWKKVEPYERKE